MFNKTEKRYWFIELKIADLVWIVRRVRHIIKIIKHTIVIFINYVVNISIAKQITLNNSNTNKLNLRLIRAFIYLFQFQLKVKYRLKKNYVISNAFSRLLFSNEQMSAFAVVNSDDVLNLNNYYNSMLNSSCSKQVDEIHSMQTLLIKIFDDFRKRIKVGYAAEKTWSNMLKMLKDLRKRLKKKKNNIIKIDIINNEADDKSPPLITVSEIDQLSLSDNLSSNKESFVISKKQFSTNNNLLFFSDILKKQRKLYIDINFELTNDGFIYYTKNNVRRLCISTLLKKNIF